MERTQQEEYHKSMYDTADNQSRSLVMQLDLSAAFVVLYKKTASLAGSHLWCTQYNSQVDQLLYLDGWNQFVRVGDRTSEPVPCEFGVPQGSVLGPLLFTIYTSPITNFIAQFKHVNHAQYADDTQLYVALNTDDAVGVINDCFKSVHYWLDANGLCLNPDKTEAIVIGTGTRLRSEEKICAVKVADATVPVTTVKNLGVTIHSTLSFDRHVHNVCALCHIRQCMSVDDTKAVATALVSSRLDCCNSVLSGTSQSNIKLHRVQNAVTHTVMATSKREHITPVLAELHWLPIAAPIDFKIATITFNLLTMERPSYLRDLLQLRRP